MFHLSPHPVEVSACFRLQNSAGSHSAESSSGLTGRSSAEFDDSQPMQYWELPV